MKRTRRKFSASFKSKVVLEALQERATLQELSSKYEVHANQITTWKKEFVANASEAFKSNSKSEQDHEQKEELYNKIGHMQVQIDFLKKALEK